MRTPKAKLKEKLQQHTPRHFLEPRISSVTQVKFLYIYIIHTWYDYYYYYGNFTPILFSFNFMLLIKLTNE